MTEALDKLIAAVEAGDLTVDGAPALSMEMSGIVYAALGDDLWATCVEAFDGSLDAAVALKDALLTKGTHWGVDEDDDCCGWVRLDGCILSYSATPARALLLATLRAVKGGEDG